ncbi:MAG: hypothetical protein EZS28_050024, partial [Streblomastix strix]
MKKLLLVFAFISILACKAHKHDVKSTFARTRENAQEPYRDKVLCFNPGNMTDNRELIIDYQYTNPDTAYIEVPFSDRNPYR